MALLICEECGRYINTDDDPGSYVEALDMWFCESCREKHEMATEQDREGDG